MTNKEIWKPIKGYENSYQVSSWGRIRSLDRFVFKGSDKVKSIQKGQIIKPWLNSDGYLRVCLCKKGFKKYKKVHRLVAETFIPNPKNKLTVNHIKNTMSWKIKQIKNKTVVNIFNSLHEAEETTKIPRQSISYAVKHGTHLKNYMWERG
ncbi:NUMOD4 domain-containing protein [Oenococcus oeni]|uniref:NUMOD4 domain-containing protein n=1 Tax=Oenococcus oeni TaxID=1247 RepID=UPI0008F80AEB|nr:NUMOD4 domain-containing protein [Oenococcus oeni]OIL89940.1 HNH endonuclease [Oenococcus oeni]